MSILFHRSSEVQHGTPKEMQSNKNTKLSQQLNTINRQYGSCYWWSQTNYLAHRDNAQIILSNGTCWTRGPRYGKSRSDAIVDCSSELRNQWRRWKCTNIFLDITMKLKFLWTCLSIKATWLWWLQTKTRQPATAMMTYSTTHTIEDFRAQVSQIGYMFSKDGNKAQIFYLVEKAQTMLSGRVVWMPS